MNSTKHKIGLTLSGGGTRGYAHLGIIQYLKDNNIPIEIMSGSSAGALAAALCSTDKSVEEIIPFLMKHNIWKLIGFELPWAGFTSLNKLIDPLTTFTGISTFEELNRPIQVAVTNLSSGELELYSKGDLWKWVVASCSIPMVFKPVEVNGNLYSDGGILRNIPAKSIRAHCEYLIGVNLIPKVNWNSKNLNSFKGIGARIFELSIWDNSRDSLESCDLTINVNRLKNVGIFDFKKAWLIYEIGYNNAKAKIGPKLDEIRTYLDQEVS